MRRYAWLTIFAIAMAYLEAAVVVYLRALYYPQGFDFPLVLIPAREAAVEIAREAATIVMLWVGGRLGAATGWQAFAGFMFLFGVWDIFYYVWLKVILGWPASLLTWDVLFLLPLVWVGPVISAVLVAVSLVAAGAILLGLETRDRAPVMSGRLWGGFAVALLLLLGAFMGNHAAIRGDGMPGAFPWIPYGAGFALGWAVFLRALR